MRANSVISFLCFLLLLKYGHCKKEGECREYRWGGKVKFHFYVCCNNCHGPYAEYCNRRIYQTGNATAFQYCGDCGEDMGNGHHGPKFVCGGCVGQDKVEKKCLKALGPFIFPGTCFVFTWCMRKRCEDKFGARKKRQAIYPLQKNDSLLLNSTDGLDWEDEDGKPWCGDGNCERGETAEGCPLDCCQTVSPDCKFARGVCPPQCCGEPSCCKDDPWRSKIYQINGNVTAVSARGNEVWVLKTPHNPAPGVLPNDDEIYRFGGDRWYKLPGGTSNVAASPDGWTWIVNGKSDVYRWNLNSLQWDRMPGVPGGPLATLSQISAASKDLAIGVGPPGPSSNVITLWEHGTWTSLAPRPTSMKAGGIWASIGELDERWAVAPDRGIWRWSHEKSDWEEMPYVGRGTEKPGAISVDVHSPERVIAITQLGDVFRWDPRYRDWIYISRKAAKGGATVNDNYVITAFDGNVSMASY